jgi:hypothetical protein
MNIEEIYKIVLYNIVALTVKIAGDFDEGDDPVSGYLENI